MLRCPWPAAGAHSPRSTDAVVRPAKAFTASGLYASADTCSMGASSIPAVFAFLADERNAAADAALVDVLPDLEPAAQQQAIGILCKRGDLPSLTTLVGRFNVLSESLQALIVDHIGDLFTAVRLAAESTELEHREGAIELIVRSGCGPLLYVLADALRHRCPQTRESAAAGLHHLTDRLLNRLDADPDDVQLAELNALADGLADAHEQAIMTWEIHLQPPVLQAALWMGDRVESSIRRKLQDRRTKIAGAIGQIIEGTSDPRLAGFSLRALAIPELRASAARAIGMAANTAFRRAVAANSWLLVDADIRQGCRSIRQSPWLHGGADELLKIGDHEAAAAVRFLGATGGPTERKMSLLAELGNVESDEIRRAVVWQLVSDRSDAATDLLARMAGRCRGRLAEIVTRELDHRRPAAETHDVDEDLPEDVSNQLAGRRAFEHFWNEYDRLEPPHRRTLTDAMSEIADSILPAIREKLSSGQPVDRRRALGIVSDLALSSQLEEWIYKLAHDPDSLVRSRAIAMLSSLPGTTSRRILRTAVNDRDERVQANAIEALDMLDIEDRIGDTIDKLASPNNRVRANAVKSLLRAEVEKAGETLISMLSDPSTAQRISALWVVERLQLRTILTRVSAISERDPDERVRRRAQRVLRHLESQREPRSVPVPQPAQNAQPLWAGEAQP